ncbi:vacuolar membrane protein-domain-containing protein [Lanmaoa asiatica]|nr:vacuolar membrane protein-domain-containing protein [Lanmaoa asiatica]
MSSIARVISKSLGDFPLDRRSCQLLGPTALIVQALMGILAVLSLVYKRHRETQKRPWKIWLFDVSKQVFGQMFVHGLNVLISDLGSHHSAGNACTYYFLNILLDTTLGRILCISELTCGSKAADLIGVGLIYLVLQSSTWLLSKKLGIKGLKTGQYGNPPSVTFWVRQAAVYVFSITTMKLLVVALFAVWPGISSIGDWLLGWTTIGDGDSVQVIFVMGIFPVIMNVLQFWLIDSIVKASTISTPIASLCLILLTMTTMFHPRDIETGPRSSTSRTTSEGDFKTLVDMENDKTKSLASGSSSPMTLPRTPVVVAHDYPPNNAGSVSSHGSTRSRHKYKRSPSSLLDLPIAYSAPAVNPLDSTRNFSRQALLSKSLDSGESTTGDVSQFDAWEKNGWEERGGGEGRNGP